MTTTRRWQGLCAAGLGLSLAGLAGCQTHIIGTGLTLPSGHYLEHPPQYFPPSPPFPLTRELAQQERALAGDVGAGVVPGGPPAPPPLPAPPDIGGRPAPQPAP